MFTGYIFIFLSHVFTYTPIPFFSPFLVFGIFPLAGSKGKYYCCCSWSVSWECEIGQLHFYSPTQDPLCNSSGCHPTQHRLPIGPELSAFLGARAKQ